MMPSLLGWTLFRGTGRGLAKGCWTAEDFDVTLSSSAIPAQNNSNMKSFSVSTDKTVLNQNEGYIKMISTTFDSQFVVQYATVKFKTGF